MKRVWNTITRKPNEFLDENINQRNVGLEMVLECICIKDKFIKVNKQKNLKKVYIIRFFLTV